MGWNVYVRMAQQGARHGELRRRYHAYLRSTAWREKRQWVLALSGRQCARCGSASRLAVHHVHYRTIGEEGLADVRVVCRSCHHTDHAGLTDGRIPMTPQQVAAWRALREPRSAETLGGEAFLPREPVKAVRRRPAGSKSA